MIKTISIIGSGNVATHLGKGLQRAGLEIVEVFSPNRKHASELAELLEAKVPDGLRSLSQSSDLYLLCVPDRSVERVSREMPHTTGIVAHTSGITPLSAVKWHTNHGVFYPLQTFSKIREISLRTIPFCLEASSEKVYKKLFDTASLISENVREVNSKNRMSLHLSAVFVNNFVNYFYTIGAELLKEKELSFDILIPLIEETAQKIKEMPPAQAQTGPAMRNDRHTIALHKQLLTGHSKFKQLYKQISNLIIQKYYE